MTQAKVLPFEQGTRQRRKAVGTYTATYPGTVMPGILLPSIGLAAGLHIKAYGTMTFSAAGTAGLYAPWALFNRIQLSVNLGSALLYDTSGFGNYLIQPWVANGYYPDNAGGGSTTPDATNIYANPTSGSAQPFLLHYYVPIALNLGADLGKGGTLNLQSPEIQAYLYLTLGQLADISTTCTAVSITGIEVDYDFYEVPPQPTYKLPPLVLNRILQQTAPISATGDQTFVCPRLGVLMRWIHMMTTNGARTDCLSQDRVVLNQTDYVYTEEPTWTKQRFRAYYDLNNPTGVYYRDLWDAVIPGQGFGSLRDAINTELYAELDLVATVSSGTTLGSGNNFHDVIRQVGQPMYTTGQAAQAA